jgi:hypothetical protein
MGFILGLLIGQIVAVGLLIFLIYWLCRRSNNVAVAKFVNGIVQALMHEPKPTEPAGNGEAAAEATGEEGRGRTKKTWRSD